MRREVAEKRREMVHRSMLELREAVADQHSKHYTGPGAVDKRCVCGKWGGGSLACTALALLEDFVNNYDCKSAEWKQIRNEISDAL